MQTATFLIPPFSIEIDGAEATILEVSKQTLPTNQTWYIVSVSIKYKGIKSKVFPLFVTSEEDLRNKLKVEVTKIKMMDLTLGIEEVKRLVR